MNDSETDSPSIKALIVFRENGETDNLFVPILCDAIRMAGIDVRCSTKEFWDSDKHYDIIHFQWPEEVVGWTCNDPDIIRCLEERISFFVRGEHVLSTHRHNVRPHYATESSAGPMTLSNRRVISLYTWDGLAGTNFTKYPDSQNVVILITFTSIPYKEDISVERARQYLNLSQDASSSRLENSATVKKYAWCSELSAPGTRSTKMLLAPRLYPFRDATAMAGISSNDGFQKAGYYLLMPLLNRMYKLQAGANDELIDNCDLPYYMAASDVIFIQRKDILNWVCPPRLPLPQSRGGSQGGKHRRTAFRNR